MKSPSISTWLLTILPFLTTSFSLPQSPNSSAVDTSLSKPTTPLLPLHFSSFIIPPSTSAPDLRASYLITFTPTSTPPTPLPSDGIDYCFSRLGILASRFDPPSAPLRRPLACRLVDALVVLMPATLSLVDHAEVGYLLEEVGRWMAHRGEGEGWYGEGVQRWYRCTWSGETVGLVEMVMSKGEEAGGMAVTKARRWVDVAR